MALRHVRGIVFVRHCKEARCADEALQGLFGRSFPLPLECFACGSRHSLFVSREAGEKLGKGEVNDYRAFCLSLWQGPYLLALATR